MKRTNSTGPGRGGSGIPGGSGSRRVRNCIAEAASTSKRKPQAAAGRLSRRGVSPHSIRGLNRSSLSVAVVPFACLGIMCCFSLMQRAAAAIVKAHSTPGRLGKMTAQEAEEYADDICSAVTGANVTPVEISGESAYSWRRHTPIREWNVLCDSARGQYLLRFNADTQRIYGINHLGPSDGDPGSSTIDCPDCGLPMLTRAMAEKRARLYLRLAGVAPSNLEPVRNDTVEDGTSLSQQPQWHFVYRQHHPAGAARTAAPLLMISVDGQSGGLEHLWNPTNAL